MGTTEEGHRDVVAQFEEERPRLTALAARMLGDHAEAQDVVQQAWLRLDRIDTVVDSLPAWLTTVTSRLCLDRLRARVASPTGHVVDEHLRPGAVAGVAAPPVLQDPADHVALADEVGAALHVVLDRLTPAERVAFVLHDTFGVEFSTVAAVLDTTPVAARKLASRARTKVALPEVDAGHDDAPTPADWEVVDAFMAAARDGEFERLLALLAPDAAVRADEAAVLVGTPDRIDGRREVAEFFNGSARAALPVFVGDRAGSAWFDRGVARVVFDFTVADGRVRAITFRADPETLAAVVRRDDGVRR